MKKVTIHPLQKGQRVDKFLLHTFPNIPPSLLFKYFRKKRIKLNDKKCPPNTLLQEWDVLSLYIEDRLLEDSYTQIDSPTVKPCTISFETIYEDENIIIINKPPLTSIHDGEGSLHHQLEYYYQENPHLFQWDLNFRPTFPHRLDTNTKGLIIGCKNPLALREMSQIIKNNGVKKEYLAIVHGKPNWQENTFIGYHKKLNKNQVIIHNIHTADSVKVQTKCTAISTYSKYSLVSIQLITGKKHQIRCHLQTLGYPIVGDIKYTLPNINTKSYRDGQFLYSNRLTFHLKDTSLSLLNYLDNQSYSLELETELTNMLKSIDR